MEKPLEDRTGDGLRFSLWVLEEDGSGLRLCPVAAFGIGVVKLSCSVALKLVKCLHLSVTTDQNRKEFFFFFFNLSVAVAKAANKILLIVPITSSASRVLYTCFTV